MHVNNDNRNSGFESHLTNGQNNSSKSGHHDDCQADGNFNNNNGNQDNMNNNNGNQDEYNTNNNGNQEKYNNKSNENSRQQVLRMPVNDMKQGFQDVDVSVRRVRPKSGRPKTRLGLWENQLKPDSSVEGLIIDTQTNKDNLALVKRRSKTSRSNRDDRQNRVAFGRTARPISAGPTAFKKAEKQRMILRARPQSAASSYDDDICVESYGAYINDRNSTPNTALISGGKTSHSTVNYQQSKSSKKIRRGKQTLHHNENFEMSRSESSCKKMPLADVIQQTKTVVCENSGQTSLKQPAEKLSDFCSNKNQRDQQPQEQLLNMVLSSNSEQIDREKSNMDNTCDNDLVGDGMTLLNMDEMEASLTEVQKQIQSCLLRTSKGDEESHNNQGMSEGGFMESVLNMEDGPTTDGVIEDNGSSDEGKTSRNTQITVYQYTETSGNPQKDDRNQPEDGNNNNKGSIITYDVKLVNPAMNPVFMELVNG